jgi:hypothetical protein
MLDLLHHHPYTTASLRATNKMVTRAPRYHFGKAKY